MSALDAALSLVGVIGMAVFLAILYVARREHDRKWRP